MWKRAVDKGILVLLVVGITIAIGGSIVIARADEDHDSDVPEEPAETLSDQFQREYEEWNADFEKKLHTPRPEPEKISDRQKTLAENILLLQPKAGKNRAIHLAKLIIEHADFSKIPHENFVAAIIYRESRFAQRVENGKQRGLLGELGLMQVMPRGYAVRAFGNDCEQTDATCNIMTGTRYLEDAHETCGTDDPWVWMSAYASGKCPSPRSARHHKSAKNARRYFCKITPDCEEHWPL